MAGAIAGTALVNFASDLSDKLSTVTLTVNNVCNLSCPHCYLQYAGGEEIYIADDVLQQLAVAEFKHLVVVGKEPLVNKKTIELVDKIVQQARSQGRTVGIITNGFGLDKITPELVENLSYIDISFDGGEKSYGLYRKGDFKELMMKINSVVAKYNFSRFNVLHVVNNETIDNLEDMLSVRGLFSFNHMMFSPYLETSNDGNNSVKKLKLQEILSTFAKSRAFMQDSKAFILLDTYHLLGDLQNKISFSEFMELPNLEMIKKIISKYGLTSKVKLIENDPIKHGFVRLTYDGFMLSPYASLNPADYKKEGIPIGEMSLQNFFNIKSQAVLH